MAGESDDSDGDSSLDSVTCPHCEEAIVIDQIIDQLRLPEPPEGTTIDLTDPEEAQAWADAQPAFRIFRSVRRTITRTAPSTAGTTKPILHPK